MRSRIKTGLHKSGAALAEEFEKKVEAGNAATVTHKEFTAWLNKFFNESKLHKPK